MAAGSQQRETVRVSPQEENCVFSAVRCVGFSCDLITQNQYHKYVSNVL